MTAQRLLELLRQSLGEAQKELFNELPPRLRHSKRAAVWVKHLAHSLQIEYPDLQVLARPLNKNLDFELNELLYDIVVIKTAMTENFVFVQDIEWEIESELSKHRKHAVIDFSKLVIGSAPNKLFIGSYEVEQHRDIFLPIAAACKASVFCAFIGHPERWDKDTQTIHLWKFEDGGWSAV